MEKQTFIQKLKTLDLGPIAYKLMHPEEGHGWTYERTTKALVRYLMFLFLVYLYPNAQIVPTQDVDLVWHNHILDTSKYASDCEMLFGRFVHHFPYLGLQGKTDKEKWASAFGETEQLFDEHFGASVREANLLNDDKSQPAACEPLRKPKNQRPSVHVELASALDAFPDA